MVGWTVCWLRSGDKGKVFFLVMPKRVIPLPRNSITQFHIAME